MWNEIKGEQDLMQFQDQMRHFHDSCIKEIRYLSGAYVDREGMFPINERRGLSVIVQGNFKNISMIEMEFSELKYLWLFPVDPAYTCEILEAFMTWKDEYIYWYDDENLLEETANGKGTVICAKKLRWRAIEGNMGPEEFYRASK